MSGGPITSGPIAGGPINDGGPMPEGPAGMAGATQAAQPGYPNYAWPSYAPYPNFSAVGYPTAYPWQAWPNIGPFYPYPEVPPGLACRHSPVGRRHLVARLQEALHPTVLHPVSVWSVCLLTRVDRRPGDDRSRAGWKRVASSRLILSTFRGRRDRRKAKQVRLRKRLSPPNADLDCQARAVSGGITRLPQKLSTLSRNFSLARRFLFDN